MSRYRRAKATGSSYFFTVVAYRRQSILCDEAIRNALRASGETVRVERPFIIDAWVLLPDHLHCMWTLPDDDADFSTRWMIIKRASGFFGLQRRLSSCRLGDCIKTQTLRIDYLATAILGTQNS